MSEPLPAPAASNTFERIKRVNAEGQESWSARDLARVLEYLNFRNFQPVIDKAKEACATSGHAVADHFAEMRNMVGIGSGAQRELEDWTLSRYACYLVIQNADPAKPLVALGQSYFAVQTRRQELADDEALKEDTTRLLLRGEMKKHNKNLAGAAKQAGVIQPVISHLKHQYRLIRCFLKGFVGDQLNLLLAAAAWNLKKWLRTAAFFWLQLIRLMAANQTPTTSAPCL